MGRLITLLVQIYVPGIGEQRASKNFIRRFWEKEDIAGLR
jgi:hypothetical protein